MIDYIPMKGPLPGKQWIPSNGDMGYSFLNDNCTNCARDKAMREGVDIEECDDNEKCSIIAASFMGKAVEWRELDDGSVTCLAFVEAGTEPPEPRCEHTKDLFGFGAI